MKDEYNYSFFIVATSAVIVMWLIFYVNLVLMFIELAMTH